MEMVRRVIMEAIQVNHLQMEEPGGQTECIMVVRSKMSQVDLVEEQVQEVIEIKRQMLVGEEVIQVGAGVIVVLVPVAAVEIFIPEITSHPN